MSSLLTAGATAGLVAVAATLPAWVAAAVGAAWAVLEQQGSTRVVIVPAANTSKVSEEVRLHGFSLILVPGNT